jgi:hypothetical protein
MQRRDLRRAPSLLAVHAHGRRTPSDRPLRYGRRLLLSRRKADAARCRLRVKAEGQRAAPAPRSLASEFGKPATADTSAMESRFRRRSGRRPSSPAVAVSHLKPRQPMRALTAYRKCWIDSSGRKETGTSLRGPRSSRPNADVERRKRRPPGHGHLSLRLLAEVEVVEAGWRRMHVDVDRFSTLRSTTNASPVSATSTGESIGRMNSHTGRGSASSPPGSASRSLRSSALCRAPWCG